jgi:hypothetical protein
MLMYVCSCSDLSKPCYLEDSKKTSSTNLDDSSTSSGQSGVCIITTILKFVMYLAEHCEQEGAIGTLSVSWKQSFP